MSGGSISARLHLGTDSRLEISGEEAEPLTIEIRGTGATLRWFTDHFTDSDQSIAVVEGTTVFDIIDGKASGLPPGCEGLLCLIPGQAEGEGEVPGIGGLIGIAGHHGRYHVYRAILEGAAFALRSGMERSGVQPQDLTVIEVAGPGARSRLWLQIHADVLGVAMKGEREAQPDPARRDIYEAAYGRFLRLTEATRA